VNLSGRQHLVMWLGLLLVGANFLVNNGPTVLKSILFGK